MTLTEREQFIVVLMAQRPTDNIAKKTRGLSKEMRVGILKYIKNKKFPTISDEEWIEIAHDMDKVQRDMKSLFMEGWQKGDKLPESIKEDKDALELDRTTLANMDKIDLDELSKDTDLGSELSPEHDALRKAKELKKDYDEKR